MDGHTHGGVEPVTDHVHENSWSANVETPEHAGNRELVVEQATDAVAKTAPGYHVNLVTHGDCGHPSEYLYGALEDHAEDDADLEYEYVEQCGCGGHVTRVHVRR